MAGPLADIYSASDTFKRKLIDALRNPAAKLEQVLGDANDRARDWNEADKAALDEVMATGKINGPKMMGQAMALAQGYNPAGITVWHGSPHGPFAKFDASKIGTGEGAQAYGRGHYTGEARATGEEYRKALSSKIDVNGKPLYDSNKIIGTTGNSDLDDYLVANLGDVAATKKQLLSDIRDVRSGNPPAAKEMQQTLAALRNAKVNKKENGYLYKIDLPDEQVSKMVEWETPLSEQSDQLRAVIDPLQQALMQQPNPSLFKNARSVGDVIQYANSVGLNPHESLKAAGYPGIKYLDEQSRAAGKGTRNFVVFPGNEDMLKILEVNDQPIIDALRKRK